MSAKSYVHTQADGSRQLHLLVDGMHCPSCVAIIENALAKQSAITQARLNLSTRRLNVVWQGAPEQADTWVALINAMGYRAVPFDAKTAETAESKEERFLLRCLAVAGFASGNLMLFSIPLWSSDSVEMGDATRTFFHWVQAAIAIPAIAYCGLPFYRSAWRALKERHTNMDVPISVAVILATLMSLFETLTYGRHSYFDSGVMLLFFLLIGRYLEARAKGRARSAAHDLLALMSGTATRQRDDGTSEPIALAEIREGMRLQVAAGEKIGADGEIISGQTELDTSLITGESLPQRAGVGDAVFAGTLNLSAPIVMRATRAQERSLLAEIVRLMEVAEQSQARYVTLADRISGWYTPAVHALAALTFFGWWWLGGAVWQQALLYAATVLIITCPCALGLAVPVVQVLASSTLMRAGILLKSGSALERLSTITHAVFDKTGTLTLGRPQLLKIFPEAGYNEADALAQAAALATHSKHPLSQALAKAAASTGAARSDVLERPGLGLEAGEWRLGKQSWAAPGQHSAQDDALELWLSQAQKPVARFTFSDQLKRDAKDIITRLKQAHITPVLLSGDRPEVTARMAAELGIADVAGGLSPVEKTERIHALKKTGAKVMMVGDGLNDAPSLTSADISLSPTSAIDITQNAADIVFQGERLSPVLVAWATARFSQRLVRENFWLAIAYNIIAIPLAVAGMVTPLIAAIAMSSSSLLVIANAMRLTLRKEAQ